MKKLILILFFIFSFLNIQSVSAKTVKWDFEVKSTNTELIKCIKVLEVKSKRSLLSSITGMGIVSETPTIVKMQNKCKEGIKGWFRIKLLDEDGFMIDDWLEQSGADKKVEGYAKQILDQKKAEVEDVKSQRMELIEALNAVAKVKSFEELATLIPQVTQSGVDLQDQAAAAEKVAQEQKDVLKAGGVEAEKMIEDLKTPNQV